MTEQTNFQLKTVELPAIGYPSEPRPELPEKIFINRLARVRQRMIDQRLDALVVYGDREHFGNLHYLTNYDPRFEESLLVILPEGRPTLFVGNEGMGYSTIARLDVERCFYQPFSLLGQPRDKVKGLDTLLHDTGLGNCSRVGEAGWKYFSDAEFPGAEEYLDLPDFIASSLRRAIKPGGRVTNEGAIFMDPETGLRNINEPEQLADFEWIATWNSQSLLDGIRAMRAGMTEQEAFASVPYNGLPFCCHPLCTSGELLTKHGMASATSRRLSLGDPVFMSMSYQGANTCRFGWVAHDSQDLAAGVKDYVDKVAVPYAEALASWYEALRIGATGNDLHHAVCDKLIPLGFALDLNIGHQIAYDEWTHSSSASGSKQEILSGMYWQADFFATVKTAHHGAFAEDGIAVADKELRSNLIQSYPNMWKRIEARRHFAIDILGFNLADDLLPFSNIQARMMPYFLSPEKCIVRR
ncbi:MAG: aminopeptidase P family N-terminal domain-containing protein [Armatimonadota bacterium]